MARPRKSTRDAWLDQLADVPVDVQENWLEMANFVHHLSKRKAVKNGAGAKEEPEPDKLDLRETR